MHLNRYSLRNFRRLEKVEINLEEKETIFVGANNAGKTSATAAFRLFVSRDRAFKIHDFSASLIAEINKFGEIGIASTDVDELNGKLPRIELDLWFTVSPAVEYGRVADFLPTLGKDYSEVGVRICFSAINPIELHEAYLSVYPKGDHKKSLSYFLGQSDNLTKYFSLQYFSLEKGSPAEEPISCSLDKNKAQKTLALLLRVDYVEAQRNIDDKDSAQSNRLSSVFADFYKHNLKQREHDEASALVIDKSNDDLSAHYRTEFEPLVNVISNLGFPALNDRGLRVISNLSPEKALSGNTAITYIDDETKHELPEAYNGLGFKNLIYLAIQIAHFQIQWLNTELNRPLCQLIFIEEPEAHLHAQVQQTFIRKIRDVMKGQVFGTALQDSIAQLVITTHSSHIIAEADFRSIRYFRRSLSKCQTSSSITKSLASDVVNIAAFQDETEAEDLKFLKKYLALTHCDLFFADAAILVEGTVERLLMPKMIKEEVPELESAYLTILELGGAYAHKFASLLRFINLPTLVITDLDSVDPNKNNSACRASEPNAVTSNASIKSLLLNMKNKQTNNEKGIYDKKRKIDSLLKLTSKDKECSSSPHCYVTFQQAVPVSGYGKEKTMIPRTFEETFIYENLAKIRENKIDAFITLEDTKNYEHDYTKIYESVKSDKYKKSEFALNMISTEEKWATPAYIIEGLKWLSNTLKLNPETVSTPVGKS